MRRMRCTFRFYFLFLLFLIPVQSLEAQDELTSLLRTPPALLVSQPISKNGTIRNSVGRRVRNFVLPDTEKNEVGLCDYVETEFLVVAFMGTQCPIGNAYVPDLIEIEKKYADQGVKVIGINPNLADTMQDVIKHKKEYGIKFPILKDKEQLVVDLFGATRTPEVFILDRRRNIRYQGRIDDRIGYDFKRAKARRSDLLEALNELVHKREVSVEYTKTLGCVITRKSSLFQPGEITYTQDIAPILEKRCVECHHKGTVAPFSLTTYEETREWKEMIREVVTLQRMPPWDADPRHQQYSNDLRMKPSEIQKLSAWIDDGAPIGDMKNVSSTKKFAAGWTIPKPDAEWIMPEEVTIPAKGTVQYKYFVTPTNFKKDRWIQAAEARPGNPKVVHHIIGFVRPKGKKFNEGLPAIAGYAPGEEPMIYPKGTGFKVPAGADIVWQVHYTPIGKKQTDQSTIGIVFCDEEPAQREVFQDLVINPRFRIPPHAKREPVVAEKTFDNPLELISLMPHMHVRGSAFKYTAYPPNGKPIVLLDVPHYDFNWQHRYRFEKPFKLPAGTKIKCEAHFDNSLENPYNPDPEKLVKWGQQTWDEMMIGYFNYVEPIKD